MSLSEELLGFDLFGDGLSERQRGDYTIPWTEVHEHLPPIYRLPDQTSPSATPPHEAPSEHPQPSRIEAPPASPEVASGLSEATLGPRPQG